MQWESKFFKLKDVFIKNKNFKPFCIINFFYKSCRENFLCDVILVTTDEEEFPCHKTVLASSSSYFHAMFNMEFEESRQKRIIIQEVDPKALRLLLDYVYTSEIKVNEHNVQVCNLNLIKEIL